MKRIFKLGLIIPIILILAWACKKIEVGFISDYIKYVVPAIKVTQGTYYVSPLLAPDGSTLPLNVELLEVRNKETGQVATDLITPRPVLIWTKPYNYKTDITEALVMAKLEKKDLPAFEVNEVSGQIIFNANTKFATGKKYEADLRISNVKGSKDYKGIAQIEMTPLTPVVYTGGTVITITDKAKNSTFWTFTENLAAHNAGTSAIFKVTKISNASDPGITVSLKVVDKNGVPFSPKKGEVQKMYPGSVLPVFDDTSINTEYNDDAIVFHFPVLPFPFYTWYNTQPFMYYHIVDTAVGDISVPGYNPARAYYLKFRTNMKIFEPGTWEIKVIFPNVTHK
jgi:hypothetical protein